MPTKIEIAWAPLLPVHVNSTGPFTFIVDTGYVGPNLSSHLATRLCLARDEDDFVTLNALNFGGLTFKEYQIYVSDNAAVTDILGRAVDGILGMGLLKYLETTIDYPASTISFTRLFDRIGRKYVADPRRSYVRIKFVAGYAIVPVGINGNGPYDFLLDTGSRSCVVSDEVAGRIGLRKGARHECRTGAGVWNACDSQVEELTVGGKSVNALPVAVVGDTEIARDTGIHVAGVLGATFLRNFRVTFSVVELFLGLGS